MHRMDEKSTDTHPIIEKEISESEADTNVVPLSQEENPDEVKIPDEPDKLNIKVHIVQEVTPKEDFSFEKPSDLSSEEPLETKPPVQEEERETIPSPVIQEIIEEPLLEDHHGTSEEFINPQIIKPEKKKRQSRTVYLLFIFLIIFASMGIYYTTQRQSEEPIETVAVYSEQDIPKETSPVIQSEQSKPEASEAEKHQTKPSLISQIKPEKPKTNTTAPTVKKPAATAPTPTTQKSTPDLTAPKENKQTYSVQVGVFRKNLYAVAYAKEFIKKGYDVFIDKSTIKDKGIMYKVLIGQFTNMEDTSQLAMDIREKENIDVFIIGK